MTYELEQLEELSGNKATIYSLLPVGSSETLFDNFVSEYYENYPLEIEDIVNTIEIIGFQKGAREHLFKINEGKPGDGVVALFDEPDRNLRLYALRLGNSIVILGGGGFKSKEIRALQEDPKLSREQELMTALSAIITQRIISKEMWYSSYGKYLEGNLIIEI